jgi:hypothetical protein
MGLPINQGGLLGATARLLISQADSHQKFKFVSLPDWSKPTYPPSLFNLFERFALCGLEGQWVRMSAKDQKETMGFPVFGKQEIKIADGLISIRRSVCFGTDSEVCDYEPHVVRSAIEKKLKLSPGVFGRRYA